MALQDRPRATIDPDTLASYAAAEGKPDREYDPGHASRIPRKHIAAGALIRNSHNQVLFVVPVYKPTLEIPGGVCEENESPRATCEREIKEELGLSRSVGDLLVIDWLPTHGIWRDSMQMIYDGGLIADDELSQIELPPDEIESLNFLSLKDARALLRPALARRIKAAMKALTDGRTIYAEFGQPL